MNEYFPEEKEKNKIFEKREKLEILNKNMRKVINEIFEMKNKSKSQIPLSLVYTKLELPVYYSNVVSIEDMKNENSNYFINSNGFLSSKVYVIFFYLLVKITQT